MKVLVATEKPFSKAAVEGIRNIVEEAGYTLATLEKYTDVQQLYDAVAELAEQRLSWKRTTTYTILKRLCDRGLFQNQEGTVTSLVSREEFYARQSEQFVEDTFQGSLPAFLAAFGSRKKLSDAEIDELQKVIDSMRG